jgi:hypothetical protein
MALTVPQQVRMVAQQKGHGDCAVASLAMLCGVDWPTAFAAFDNPRNLLLHGVRPWTPIKRAALRLGVKTRVASRVDMERDTGILYVSDRNGPDGHAVFLWAGRIVEGDGSLWLFVSDYLRAHNYEAHSLLRKLDG